MLTWERDDSSASVWTRGYVALMRLSRDDEAFDGAARTLATARSRQSDGDRPPTPWTRLRSRIQCRDEHGMTVWTVSPRRRRPVARVVYLHGGGYVHPLTVDYWRLVRSLLRVPAEVVVPTYPLAPSHQVDDVLPRLVALVAEKVRAPDALPVALMGDSAGGALVLSVAMVLRDAGRELPSRLVALSPWLDARLLDPGVADLESTDPMLDESGLRVAGRWWAGQRGLSDWRVSPVEGDLAGLPPVDVLIGDHDILRPAVDRLAERARDVDTMVHVREWTAMFHVWMTRATPEGRRARHLLVDLVRAAA